MLGKTFALVGLAEIPFAEGLPVNQDWIRFINLQVATEKGSNHTTFAGGDCCLFNKFNISLTFP